MTITASTSPAPGMPIAGVGTGYRPGVCNIGPEEIARRRRGGHIGLIATVVALVVLGAIDAPPIARLLIAIPAVIAASGYLQARFKFCAGFGSRGILNFGPVGETESVVDDAARRLDRARARQIGLAGLGIGAVVGMVAVLLPL
jgi:hypothetical protein